MANLVEYVKTVWENGKTALNAARMNNMEQGISNCASQINKLGDSVSQSNVGLVSFDQENGNILNIRIGTSVIWIHPDDGIGIWDSATSKSNSCKWDTK